MTDLPFSDFKASSDAGTQKGKSKFKRMKGYLKKSLLLPVIILVVFAVLAIFLIGNSLRNTSTGSALGNTDQRVNVEKPKATQEINKTFDFPLKDDSGKEVSKLKYTIQNAQLQDEIIVKGQKATAVEGRTFLIINIKITNNYDKSITLNSRDYIRLTVNGTDEKLAPDIHNDPVDVQPISTKYTRLGFPINDTDKNLTLQVGEINGQKQVIKLNKLQ